ncbi:putative reverse transcriptase domain-containing protein [Tanacetum coccineum]
MPIKLGTFDVIIGMDWLVKNDTVIICGEKVVRIPYGNKTLIVESYECVSRLKVISYIKARKYIKRGCHLFLAHVTEKKLKENSVQGQRRAWKAFEDYLELLKKERLYAKFSKCDFWLDSVQFLGHVIDNKGVHVDPAKIEAIKNWAALTTPTKLTLKDKKYEWGKEEEEAFQTLKQKLCSAPILALPERTEDFVVYCDASLKSYGAMLMQREKVIAYASRQLKVHVGIKSLLDVV